MPRTFILHRRRRSGAWLSICAGVVVIAVALLGSGVSQAADARSAAAELVKLEIFKIPGMVDGFAGTYNTAATPDLSSPSDTVDGDTSDPDGVLGNVEVHGTQIVETGWAEAPGQLTARSNATGFDLLYNGVDDFLTAGSVDSYARCDD